MIKPLHNIQIEILLKLMQSPDALRFSRLLPEDLKLESYKFNYHLQQLIKMGFVEKAGTEYRLTEKGLNLISQYTVTGETSDIHKISVALIVLRDVKDGQEILMQKRLRHPFFGDTTTIAGKVRPGEKILDCAKRKLEEESGLTSEFQLVGILRTCKYNQEKKLLEDTFYHYCVAKNPEGKVEQENEYGENFWVPVKHALFLMKDNIDIGEYNKEIFTKITNGDNTWFYFEQDQEVNTYTRDRAI